MTDNPMPFIIKLASLPLSKHGQQLAGLHYGFPHYQLRKGRTAGRAREENSRRTKILGMLAFSIVLKLQRCNKYVKQSKDILEAWEVLIKTLIVSPVQSPSNLSRYLAQRLLLWSRGLFGLGVLFCVLLYIKHKSQRARLLLYYSSYSRFHSPTQNPLLPQRSTGLLCSVSYPKLSRQLGSQEGCSQWPITIFFAL